MAGEVARSLLRNQTKITTVENLESVMDILKVLIKEGIQQPQGYPGGPVQRKAMETEETIEEQGWLARIIHLTQGPDNDTQFKVGDQQSTVGRTLTSGIAITDCPKGLRRRQRTRPLHQSGNLDCQSKTRPSSKSTRAL